MNRIWRDSKEGFVQRWDPSADEIHQSWKRYFPLQPGEAVIALLDSARIPLLERLDDSIRKRAELEKAFKLEQEQHEVAQASLLGRTLTLENEEARLDSRMVKLMEKREAEAGGEWMDLQQLKPDNRQAALQQQKEELERQKQHMDRREVGLNRREEGLDRRAASVKQVVEHEETRRELGQRQPSRQDGDVEQRESEQQKKWRKFRPGQTTSQWEDGAGEQEARHEVNGRKRQTMVEEMRQVREDAERQAMKELQQNIRSRSFRQRRTNETRRSTKTWMRTSNGADPRKFCNGTSS